MQQAFVNLRSGRASQLPPPVRGYEGSLSIQERAMLAEVLACTAIGSPATVRRALQDFISRTGADELMITSQIFDHAARVHSFEITAAARAALS
jgi:alkanesulfonate monooxygenase SsuD/methylene tetrahydromethanopterin reductase-like flavin-dependent oxidoreductase (luciferase family)